jgi:hypothetical protein
MLRLSVHDLWLLWLCVVVAQHGVLLLLLALQSPLASRLVLRTLGVHLLLDLALTRFLGLGLVDLYQSTVRIHIS